MNLILSSLTVVLLGTVIPSAVPLLSALLIGLLGVPHGAVDLYLVSSRSQRVRELVMYLLRIALVVCTWLLAPGIMLAVFLVNSAWHFGDCDVPNTGRFHWVRAIIYGASILALFVNPLDPVVGSIITDLIRTSINDSFWAHYATLKIVAAALVMAIPVWSAGANRLTSIVHSGVIVATAYLVESLFAFTWYFTVVHAYTSMNALRFHLGGDQPWPWRKLIIAALPLSLVSWTGIGLAIVVLPGSYGLVALFVALSALTLPHSILFHRVYDSHHRRA